jgi:signal transduction histidine kinase
MSRTDRKPTFLWQVILILLPVALLAAVGLYSLRQDKLLAEQDARELANSTAQRLAQVVSLETPTQLLDYVNANIEVQINRKVELGFSQWAGGTDLDKVRRRIETWQQVNHGLDLFTMPLAGCQINEDPRLCQPRDYALAPDPPLWPKELTSEQMRLWQSAQAAEFVSGDIAAAQSALDKVIASNPPEGARAEAEYVRLCLQTHDLPSNEAAAQFVDSAWAKSDQLSEAGLPIGQLICYNGLRLLPDHAGVPDKLLGSIAWSIEYRPSPFSSRLLAEVERVAGTNSPPARAKLAALYGWWDSEDKARQILRDFREQYPAASWTNGFFWMTSSGGSYLLLIQSNTLPVFGVNGTNSVETNSPGMDVAVYPAPVVERALKESMAKAGIDIPPYLTTVLDIANRSLVLHPNGASLTNTISAPLLAEAHARLRCQPSLPNDSELLFSPFRLRFFLTNPGLLYAHQRQRSLLFGGLILLSAFAAAVGLAAAYRAFRRQLRLSEMKSNFVSSVSHELRAPIASVRLMAESLERGKIPDTSKQQEYFHFIVQECRRLSSLIENVLDFSRIEQGRKQYDFEPTNLLAVTQQTVALMQAYAEERQVKLVCAFDSDPSSIANYQLPIDGKAMQQALINLIDNALKHSPKGETVTVGLEVQSPKSKVQSRGENLASGIQHPASAPTRQAPRFTRRLLLWVDDHGPGIPASEHERIFERFYRLGSELRRETPGVGIGLSIVKHVVEAHGGRVLVDSEPGHGSRFTIELPLFSDSETPKTSSPNG